ncbi:Signal transduction histidine kinase HoxJ (hydrogenase regulation) [Paramagnetospirillum magnetotacticum MS-1]|uniref:histidine kinase n=1 Tax=Paramagnetospirillum magnetotacticum MS-1 TaxID=272627 RepID=A0A0C2YGU0_PARME|nr:ATP-binding protein [Paramagnetospirillum magnetotacticum]KIL98964.1 Signal transduction histidine kinase HoxJ (hydrogenase regulation) [Paramagnetospirillum magnetotacticum MS-1]
MATYTDPRPSSAYDFAGGYDPDMASAQETAWIEVIRKMEEVYSDLISYEVELEEKNTALEEAQRFINSVLSAVSDILIVCDQMGRIQQVNLAFLQLTGLAEVDLFERPLDELLAEGTGQLRLFSWIDAVESQDREVRFRSHDGGLTDPVALSCATRLDHRGLPAGIVLTGRPVGELRRAYEALKTAQAQLIQQEKMASLGRLIAGVAHELNNPISFVYGNVHALSKYSARIAAYLDAIHAGCDETERESLRAKLRIDSTLADLPALMEGTAEGAQRVADIVRSLKRLSFSAGSKPEEFDLGEVVAKAVQWSGSGKKGLASMDLDLPDSLMARGNPGQLHQVIVNLIENAQDAVADRPNGRVAVTGRTENGQTVLEIADNGPGIAPDIVGKVFDPFFTTKPVGKGTGLGLWISYGIIRDHNGSLEAGNGPDGGACFTIRLPAPILVGA